MIDFMNWSDEKIYVKTKHKGDFKFSMTHHSVSYVKSYQLVSFLWPGLYAKSQRI